MFLNFRRARKEWADRGERSFCFTDVCVLSSGTARFHHDKMHQIRKQAQVTPNKKSTQNLQPTFLSKGKSRKEEEIQPYILGKGDLKWSKLEKIKKLKDREIQNK